MTRVFLAAGVAALAIAAPASAGPHGDRNGGHGGGGGHAAFVNQGGGGGRGGGFAAPREQRQSAPRMERQQRSQRFAMPRAERQQRFAAIERRPERAQPHRERAQARSSARQQARQARPQHQQRMATRQQQHGNRAQAQNRQQMRANRAQAQNRQQMRANRAQAQNRQQMHANRAQAQNAQQMRANRLQQRQAMRGQQMNAQNRTAMRQQMQANRINPSQGGMAMRQQLQSQRQQGFQNLLAERHALRPDRIADVGAFRASRFASMVETPRMRVIAPAQAVGFVGQPVNTVNNYVTLAALPASVSYLYPATPNYYYQYGGGYLYQVDRGSSLIDALIPLLAGGFLPGTYLPQAYMSSYVPAYYGFNSFYPASYDYGYGYGQLCNRYAYGVVYQVDCYTGMVENVIPMYAGGYGVGQMLPAAYSYYNLPMQYRSMYYPTSDYSYWYSPGAIYQYDTNTSLITSVAALMSPGFTIGQPLPMGYGMYNVPMAYRATYYDTPNAWYRYNNGYIYQVDPGTMLVTAIVASLLT